MQYLHISSCYLKEASLKWVPVRGWGGGEGGVILIYIDRQIGTHTYKNAHIYTHTQTPFNLLLYQIYGRWIDKYIYMQINRQIDR